MIDEAQRLLDIPLAVAGLRVVLANHAPQHHRALRRVIREYAKTRRRPRQRRGGAAVHQPREPDPERSAAGPATTGTRAGCEPNRGSDRPCLGAIADEHRGQRRPRAGVGAVAPRNSSRSASLADPKPETRVPSPGADRARCIVRALDAAHRRGVRSLQQLIRRRDLFVTPENAVLLAKQVLASWLTLTLIGHRAYATASRGGEGGSSLPRCRPPHTDLAILNWRREKKRVPRHRAAAQGRELDLPAADGGTRAREIGADQRVVAPGRTAVRLRALGPRIGAAPVRAQVDRRAVPEPVCSRSPIRCWHRC